MASNLTDRLNGFNSSVGVKIPVTAATTANIALSAAQTIDSVSVTSGDRVLVKDQTDTTENGIYDVSTGTWSRSPDFDGNRDVATGTLVFCPDGTANADSLWQVSTSGGPNPGEAMAFTQVQTAGADGEGTAISVNVATDTFVDGVDFTSGSTTILPALSATPATKNDTTVHFDGVYQERGTYGLNVNVITFTSAIPAGVTNVEVTTSEGKELNTVTDGAISTAKLAALAVTTAKIAADAVTADKIDINGASDTVILAGDELLFGDVSDSNNVKKDTIQGVLDLVPADLLGKADTVILEADKIIFGDNSDSDNPKTDTVGGIADVVVGAARTYTGTQSPSETALTSTSNSIAVDFSTNNDFTHTFTENTTLANPTNITVGASGAIRLTQHASSPKTLAFGSFYDFAGGAAPTVTATNSARDTLFYHVRSSTLIEVTAVLNWS